MSMVKISVFAICGAVAFFSFMGYAVAGAAAYAGQAQAPAVTLYQGQGVDSNLVDIFPRLFRGDLRYEKTFFTAFGYYHPFETPRFLQRLFDVLHIPETDTGVELIAARHHGLQRNGEVDAAYALRFPRLHVYQLSVRFGADLGLSYALGTPSYEDGPIGDPDKRYRFQYYGAYEAEWAIAPVAHVSLVTRIHHRSGIYGIIAPRHVGSNFITLGLRYSF